MQVNQQEQPTDEASFLWDDFKLPSPCCSPPPPGQLRGRQANGTEQSRNQHKRVNRYHGSELLVHGEHQAALFIIGRSGPSANRRRRSSLSQKYSRVEMAAEGPDVPGRTGSKSVAEVRYRAEVSRRLLGVFAASAPSVLWCETLPVNSFSRLVSAGGSEQTEIIACLTHYCSSALQNSPFRTDR